jgi:DNA-binding CsgD family transcriptional regulator
VVLFVLACAVVNDMLFLIYRISMGLLAGACVLSVLLGRDGFYAASVFFGGYMCFIILLMCVCIELSNSFEIAPSIVFGIAFAVLYAGELAGSNLNAVLAGSAVEVAPCCIVAMCALFCVVLLLFTETDLVAVGIGEVRNVLEPPAAGADGAVAAAREAGAAPGDAVPDSHASLEALACAMARDYGLSPREAEVLPLLLAGRTISRIQDALFISAGTVSTHIRHIYHKTGVSRKQELLDLSESYARGKAPSAAGGKPSADAKARQRLRG